MSLSGWDGGSIDLTIDSSVIDTDLNNYTIMAWICFSGGKTGYNGTAMFADVGANNLRIAAATSDDTECYVEIAYWDEGAGEALLFIKVPTISSSVDTVITLYYDNNHADNTDYVGVTGDAVAQNAWDADYEFVFHFEQDPTGTMLDSTGNYSITSYSMIAGQWVGATVGHGYAFEVSRAIYAHFTSGNFSDQGTIEVCTKAGTTGNQGFHQMGANVGGYYPYSSGNQAYFDAFANDRIGAINLQITGSDLQQWHTLFERNQDAANGRNIYQNDQLVHQQAGEDAAAFTIPTFCWMGYNGTGNWCTHTMREYRVSKTYRSDAWIKASYYDLLDNLITQTEGTGGVPETWAGTQRIIEIEHDLIDGDLPNFPVMIYLSDSCMRDSADFGAIFDDLGDNCLKLKIELYNYPQTECYVEIEKWDSAAREAILWVRIPLISSTENTKFILTWDPAHSNNTNYVGRSGATPAQTVWTDNNYDLVLHMSGEVVAVDSSPNANDGALNGGVTATTGLISDGMAFDGTGYLDTFGDVSNAQNVNTREVFIRPEWMSNGSDDVCIMDMANVGQQIHIQSGSQKWRSNNPDFVQDGDFTDETWQHVGFTWNSAGTPEMVIYIDGEVENSGVEGGSGASDPTTLIVGRTGGANYPFYGKIAELRVSNMARSGEWMKATNLTLRDQFLNGATVVQVALSGESLSITPQLDYNAMVLTGIISVLEMEPIYCEVVALYQEDAKTKLITSDTDVIDFGLDLRAISYIGFDDVNMYCRAHDGVEVHDVSMKLMTSPSPMIFRTYVAQRLSSIKTDTGVTI